MSSELGTSIGPTTKSFVCYHAVTALMERFCQNAFAPREAMAAGSKACHLRVQLGRRPIAPSRPWGSTRPLNCLRQLPGSLHQRQWDGGSLRMHWRCRRSEFAPHCGLRTALSMRNEHAAKFMPTLPLCPSCAQIMRLARTTSRFGDLPDLYIFECRACGVSHIEAAYIEAT